MHLKDKFKLLAEHEHGYIGMCECCREFNFAYKTVLLGFGEEEMLNFFEWVSSNRFNPDHYMMLQHGRSRIFTSPHSNLYLVFNDEEITDILGMYTEARLVLEAEKILLSNRMN
jgi:hypothetical protein